MKQHFRSRSVTAVAILLLLILAFTGSAAAQEGVTYITEGDCISEASGNDICTAGDVRYSAFKVIEVTEQCDSTSDTFTARVSAEMAATARGRYDIAMWIGLTDYAATNAEAEPGDGARFGDSCYRQILSPVTTDPEQLNVTDGEGPYASLDGTADFCGDIQQSVANFANMPFDEGAVLTLPCADPDNDGVANVDACISWENNRNVACANVNQALPGTPSKCDCGSFAVPDVVIRKIIVDKVTPQSPNSEQVFSFKLDGVPTSTDAKFAAVEFTLTDAQAPFVSGALVEGMYSVVESDSAAGWTLESASCTDAAGASYDPAKIDLSGASKTVTCTFKNIVEPPDSGAPLPFSYLLIGGALLGIALVGFGVLMQRKARNLPA